MPPTSVPEALRMLLAGDAAQPLVTYLGPAGDRTELSVRTFENNVAKAANLLRDDVDATAGTHVSLRLPIHWQVSVWLGACAMTGCTAWVDGDPADTSVELAVLGPASLEGPRAPLTLASSLHPFGLPFTTALPPGVLDAAVEVRAHGDRFTPYDDVSGDSPWLRFGDRRWTQSEALAEASLLAASLGLGQGQRLLCARELDAVSVLSMLAIPLAVSGAVVLLGDREADVDAVAAREHCDAILR